MGKHMRQDHLFCLFYIFGKGIRKIGEKKSRKEKAGAKAKKHTWQEVLDCGAGFLPCWSPQFQERVKGGLEEDERVKSNWMNDKRSSRKQKPKEGTLRREGPGESSEIGSWGGGLGRGLRERWRISPTRNRQWRRQCEGSPVGGRRNTTA